MLVKIKENCCMCNYDDRGKIVDALKRFPETDDSFYVYFDRHGCEYNLMKEDIEILSVYTTNGVDENIADEANNG